MCPSGQCVGEGSTSPSAVTRTLALWQTTRDDIYRQCFRNVIATDNGCCTSVFTSRRARRSLHHVSVCEWWGSTFMTRHHTPNNALPVTCRALGCLWVKVIRHSWRARDPRRNLASKIRNMMVVPQASVHCHHHDLDVFYVHNPKTQTSCDKMRGTWETRDGHSLSLLLCKTDLPYSSPSLHQPQLPVHLFDSGLAVRRQ